MGGCRANERVLRERKRDRNRLILELTLFLVRPPAKLPFANSNSHNLIYIYIYIYKHNHKHKCLAKIQMLRAEEYARVKTRNWKRGWARDALDGRAERGRGRKVGVKGTCAGWRDF